MANDGVISVRYGWVTTKPVPHDTLMRPVSLKPHELAQQNAIQRYQRPLHYQTKFHPSISRLKVQKKLNIRSTTSCLSPTKKIVVSCDVVVVVLFSGHNVDIPKP